MMVNRAMRLIWVVAVGLALASCGGEVSPATEQAEPRLSQALAGRTADPWIRVANLDDGAQVTSPLTIEVETGGIELGPAGSSHDGIGHWHVLIDQACMAPGDPIPKDDLALHVGSGADTLELDLRPGRHRLCIQIGDGFHVAVAITDVIEVEVLDSEDDQLAQGLRPTKPISLS